MSAVTGVTPAPTSTPTSAASPSATGSGSLNQAAFLRLMTAQVAAQDPFKPLDQTAMLGQLAQFSQVAGTAEMNVALADLVSAVRDQSELLLDIRERLTPAAPAAAPTATTPTTGA